MWRNYHFGVVGEYSDLCGEEFFVALYVPEDESLKQAWMVARQNFPHEELKCYGWVTDDEADEMGLDTY